MIEPHADSVVDPSPRDYDAGAYGHCGATIRPQWSPEPDSARAEVSQCDGPKAIRPEVPEHDRPRERPIGGPGVRRGRGVAVRRTRGHPTRGSGVRPTPGAHDRGPRVRAGRGRPIGRTPHRPGLVGASRGVCREESERALPAVQPDESAAAERGCRHTMGGLFCRCLAAAQLVTCRDGQIVRSSAWPAPDDAPPFHVKHTPMVHGLRRHVSRGTTAASLPPTPTTLRTSCGHPWDRVVGRHSGPRSPRAGIVAPTIFIRTRDPWPRAVPTTAERRRC